MFCCLHKAQRNEAAEGAFRELCACVSGREVFGGSGGGSVWLGCAEDVAELGLGPRFPAQFFLENKEDLLL